MRTHLTPRWLAIALMAGLLASAGMRTAHATPLRQDFQISVVAFVDVAPATDPNCPGCNGEFDPEDADYAATHPFGTMEFSILDSTNTEIALESTEELSVGIQRRLFTVPEGPSFTVNLVAPPTGWVLCSNESASRSLTEDDFQLGNVRLEFHFNQGCQAGETATPTPSAETPTPDPNVPTNTPGTPGPTNTPSSSSGGESKGDQTEPQLGYIKGFACIDLNGNGKVDPDDPGLNDVRVYLSGGGLQLSQVTPGTGNYSFDGLGPGSYDVYVNPGSEWIITTPHKYVVDVKPGAVVQGIDFCMTRGAAVVAKAPMKVIAGSRVRLPDTGFTDLPAAPLLGMATLLLGALGALGYSAERRRNGRQ
jgi:hypothetical protein